MSFQVTEAFVQQYSSNVFHLSQQKGSRLREAVRVEMQKGKIAYYDRLGAVDPVERTTRHGDTPIIDTPHSRRGVILKDWELADMVDDQDKIRTLIDPTNPYAQAQAMAFGRKMDDVIIDAALAAALTGETGSSTASLGNGQKIASVSGGAHANLNVNALVSAKQILDAADVDPALPRYMAINASMLAALLNDTKVTSADYNSIKALVRGELDTFMGFKFIRLERLQALAANLTNVSLTDGSVGGGASTITAGSNVKSAIAWAGGPEGGLLLSIGMDHQSKISERNDKGHNTQIYSRMSIGAVRLEEEKVVQIVCKTS